MNLNIYKDPYVYVLEPNSVYLTNLDSISIRAKNLLFPTTKSSLKKNSYLITIYFDKALS